MPAPLALVELGVDVEHLGDLVADLHHRIERGHRLLEDHRDAIAANATDAGIVERQEILILEHEIRLTDDRREIDDDRTYARSPRNETAYPLNEWHRTHVARSSARRYV